MSKRQELISSLTYGAGTPIDGAGPILPVHRAGPLVDRTGRFIAGRTSLLDRAITGAEQLGIFLLRLLLSLSFLARIRVAAGYTGCCTGIVVAVGTAIAGVVIVQDDRQGATDIA